MAPEEPLYRVHIPIAALVLVVGGSGGKQKLKAPPSRAASCKGRSFRNVSGKVAARRRES